MLWALRLRLCREGRMWVLISNLCFFGECHLVLPLFVGLGRNLSAGLSRVSKDIQAREEHLGHPAQTGSLVLGISAAGEQI